MNNVFVTFLELPGGGYKAPDLKTAYEWVGVLASSSLGVTWDRVWFKVFHKPEAERIGIEIWAKDDSMEGAKEKSPFYAKAARGMLEKYIATGKAE